jgi:hypothetical protein
MQDREPDQLDRGRQDLRPFEDPGTETRLGRLAGRFAIAGVIAAAYILLRPG